MLIENMWYDFKCEGYRHTGQYIRVKDPVKGDYFILADGDFECDPEECTDIFPNEVAAMGGW